MILLFGCLLLLLGGLILWKKNVFFQLIQHTEKNERFIKSYAYQLLALGIFGVIFYFLPSRILDLFYVALVLLASAFFSIAFAKKMQS